MELWNFHLVIIGEGNYSKIFLASRKDCQQKVAIKCISKKKAYGTLDSIKEDVEKLRNINHPSVIKYHEWYEDGRTLFIVMEYVQGELLFDILSAKSKDNQTFWEYEAAIIMKKLLQAIEYLHSNKVMHKDIKPKKILLTKDGEIKLIDFGLSKWTTSGKLHTASGTPYYLAPEVLYGHKTAKSDIWSLGVLMYCLLSGTLPFVSDAQETVYEKAQEAEVTFDSRVWGHISFEAQDLITKMMDKEFHHRYNAAECLGHEWFIYSLSDANKKEYYKEHKHNMSHLLKFQRRCEVETAIAKVINRYLKTSEIESLGKRFDLLSDGDDWLDSKELWNTLYGFSPSFDQEKLDLLKQKLSEGEENIDKIHYHGIMNELRLLNEVKKLEQIKMVFYQFWDEQTDTMLLKNLKEVLEQFQIPKTDEELKEIYEDYLDEKW